MPPYDPYLLVRQYLAALPVGQHTVMLTFAELAALRGRPLPLTARLDSFYWSRGSVARHNWQALGWAATLDRQARTVTFRRSTP